MTSTRLNPLDAAWIITESRATPNHVGGLLQFRLPEGAPRDFLRQLMAEFRSHRNFSAPWNRRLKLAFNKNPVPELGRGRRHRPRIPRAPCRAALAGRRARAGRTGRPAAEHAARPEPPALGVHDHRGARGRPLRAVHQDAPFADRRRERHEAAAAGDVHRRGEEPGAAAVLGLPGRPRGASPGAHRGRRRRGQRHGRCGAGTARPGTVGAAADHGLRQDPRAASATRARAWWCPSTRRGRCSTAVCARSGASPRSSSRWQRLRALAEAAQLHAQRRGAGAVRRRAAALPAGARQPAGEVADRRHSGVGAAQGRRRHRQRDQLHRRHARHRHRRRGRAPARDPHFGAARQGACAEPAAAGDDAVHGAADGADHRHAAHRHRRAHAADVQRHDLQRARAGQAAVLPRRRAAGRSTRRRSSRTARR